MTYVFALLLLLCAYAAFARRRHVRLKARCRETFTRIFAGSSNVPCFEMGYSYGAPVFQIRFAARGDMAVDAAANAAFKRAIQDVCKDEGRTTRPFDAERSVFFTCPEDDLPPVPVVHCCSPMRSQADAGHAGAAIVYAANSGTYRMAVRDGGKGGVEISFCPWCGSGLTDSARGRPLARPAGAIAQ